MAHTVAELGGYAVSERIGFGGMAELFLGHREQRSVAIKRVLPALLGQSDYINMFQDEARLAARLEHPNLVCACETGEAEGAPYYVMEYVRGKDARKLLRAAGRGRAIPLDVALAIVCGAARGLHFAHELRDDDGELCGVVHRDVSPSNVIIGFDGRARVLDFGVAKAARRCSETRTGVIKGKSGYMSPEQTVGQAVDRRSDVFALGVLLFELTTGTRMYRASGDLELLTMAAKADVPAPSSRRAEYPAGLEVIVLGALARLPELRPATAAVLAAQLETFASEAGLSLSDAVVARYLGELFPEDMAAATAAPVAGLELELEACTAIEAPEAMRVASGSQSMSASASASQSMSVSRSSSFSLLDQDSVEQALANLDEAETLCAPGRFGHTLVAAVVPPPRIARGTQPAPIQVAPPVGPVAMMSLEEFTPHADAATVGIPPAALALAARAPSLARVATLPLAATVAPAVALAAQPTQARPRPRSGFRRVLAAACWLTLIGATVSLLVG